VVAARDTPVEVGLDLLQAPLARRVATGGSHPLVRTGESIAEFDGRHGSESSADPVPVEKGSSWLSARLDAAP